MSLWTRKRLHRCQLTELQKGSSRLESPWQCRPKASDPVQGPGPVLFESLNVVRLGLPCEATPSEPGSGPSSGTSFPCWFISKRDPDVAITFPPFGSGWLQLGPFSTFRLKITSQGTGLSPLTLIYVPRASHFGESGHFGPILIFLSTCSFES